MPDPAEKLLSLTENYLPRALCPYSGIPVSAVALLSDGQWVPGVRIESASFSLAIDAAVNAVTSTLAAGRTDIAAIALSQEASDARSTYLTNLGFRSLSRRSGRLFVQDGLEDLPAPAAELDPTVPMPESDDAGIRAAREIAGRAYIPESLFPVGCLAVLDGGSAVPGVNVEHADWNRILCAERNAVGTVISYGLAAIRRLYLSCPQDPAGSPCGACRQILAELARGSTIVMDRNPDSYYMTTPERLLPGSFTGNALRRHRVPPSDADARS